ncbi:hypothetical protein NC661_12225 [Aquibacillus koreensis]|uniref:Uncharacterized protein n=1 Tax=Aquibacillus koreensis TaxID=279446 RepID=A0A9X4AIM5_9BACI|nr:hypothetical protein [Aquibacillus koreensis]MCT2537832.1 hypothetical protein [Aquibacillus koreensis]MDC3421136.1 hypothetical protein [Aquibacillus koreensis]
MILLFFIFGYLFVLQLIKALKSDDTHHQYGLVKHLAALLFVLWSTSLFLLLTAFMEL